MKRFDASPERQSEEGEKVKAKDVKKRAGDEEASCSKSDQPAVKKIKLVSGLEEQQTEKAEEEKKGGGDEEASSSKSDQAEEEKLKEEEKKGGDEEASSSKSDQSADAYPDDKDIGEITGEAMEDEGPASHKSGSGEAPLFESDEVEEEKLKVEEEKKGDEEASCSKSDQEPRADAGPEEGGQDPKAEEEIV